MILGHSIFCLLKAAYNPMPIVLFGESLVNPQPREIL